MPSEFDSLQFVLFLQGTPSRTAVQLWPAIFPNRATPDSFQQLPGGGTQAVGKDGDISVALLAQMNRIDVVLSPSVEPSAVGLTEANAKLDPSIAQGLAWAQTLAQDEPGLFRPAVVFQTSEAFETAGEAVKRISELTGAGYPPNASDIFYQTIVSGPSKSVPMTTISRLARWNTGRKGLIRLDFLTGGTQNTFDTIVANRYVDVFADDKIAVPREKFAMLLKEVSTAAQDVLNRGYDALVQ